MFGLFMLISFFSVQQGFGGSKLKPIHFILNQSPQHTITLLKCTRDKLKERMIALLCCGRHLFILLTCSGSTCPLSGKCRCRSIQSSSDWLPFSYEATFLYWYLFFSNDSTYIHTAWGLNEDENDVTICFDLCTHPNWTSMGDLWELDCPYGREIDMLDWWCSPSPSAKHQLRE